MRLVVATLLIASLAMFGCSQKAAEKDPHLIVQDSIAPYYNTLASALTAAQTSGHHVAVDFFTDWCYWCKVIDTAVYANPKGVDFFTNSMILAKVNAEVDTMDAKKYNISAYPTIVLVDKDGREVDRIVGYYPVDDFVKILDDYTKGIGTLDDLVARAADSTDRHLYFEVADKYKYRGMPDEAEAWFGKVVEMGDPTDSLSGEARMALADLYRRAKDYDKSLAAFQSIEKDFTTAPLGPDAVIWQALVLKAKGDTAKAIAEFERFVKTYPESEDIEYATGQIEQLKNPPAAESKS